MKVVFDIEANALENPTEIWLVVCKDIDTNERYIFRNLTKDGKEKERFLQFVEGVSYWIGHNLLGYDYPVLSSLLNFNVQDIACNSCDTLIISRLLDYSRSSHSIEDYGLEFGIPKGDFTDFSKYSQEMEEYCIRDVDICHKIYLKYLKFIQHKDWQQSIELEHKFQLLVNDLHNNGFSFNRAKAEKLLVKVEEELAVLDKAILKAFPPKLKLVREITPRLTKHGTLNKSDFRFVKGGDLSEYSGDPFCLCKWVEFNPASHKQIIEVLRDAGWSPTDKTKTHIETEREVKRLKYTRSKDEALDLQLSDAILKLQSMKDTGYRINETNLATLPSTAPAPARTLADRILLESRRRTLTEWLSLVDDDDRIRGQFYGIGAWTHRMAHQRPNTANIPTDAKLYGGEMRSLWRAPRNRLLAGVDAEGIQLRIFAHYIDDAEFTKALVEGKKEDKSDAHSLNQRILGSCCQSRQTAKRFIYALLLGAGLGKLAEILEVSEDEASSALERLMERYQGFLHLKETIIPADAKRGWFRGLDGRLVRIPGDTPGARKHLCMSGYLQNGEAVVMKKAAIYWNEQLRNAALWEREFYKRLSTYKFVNMVHDEWQTECSNDMEVALTIAKLQADSLRIVGEQLGLKCPLAGSYWNEDAHDYTIATNWAHTH